jgi:hypothetical protein
MPDVTVPQWAAQIGISKQAAYKRLKSGKVKLNSRGLIDTESAAAQWEANKDARQWQRGASARASHELRSGESGRTYAPPEDRASFSEAQRAREWLRVKREKLAVELIEGKLVAVVEVEAAWSAMILTARNRLLLLPDKVAPRIAAVSDVQECRAIVDREIREALTALSEHQPNVQSIS